MSKYSILSLFRNLYFRLVEFTGVCIFLIALAIMVALISYCPEDPSFNTAIDGSASNLMSYPGSYCADILMQFLGKSSYLCVFLLISFSYQLIKYHVVLYFRILSGLLCIAITSTFCCLMSWPKFSGVLGNIFVNHLKNCAYFDQLYFSIILGILLIVTLLFAIRFHFMSTIERLMRFKDYLFTKINIPEPAFIVPQIAKKIEKKKTEAEKPKKSPMTFKKDIVNFQMPSLDLLTENKTSGERLSNEELKQRSESLINVLADFGIHGEITEVSPGPVVTLYELKPAAGIKSSRVIGLSSDIARYMSAISARVAVIPGKNALGIELPNVKRQTVYLREVLESHAYSSSNAALPISLGKDISGDPIVADLAKMPHLLIAGTTGSGKSVGINAMILSLLYRLPPEECKFIMVDPKMLELSIYDDIPHLLTPVVTDPKKAVVALKWAVKEMESRYKAMSRLGVRNIENYNAKLTAMKTSGEDLVRKVQTGFNSETGLPIYEDQKIEAECFPYVVIIVDEMADLMLVAGKEIEVAVQRLAQMARAAGIHLVMATQRPSVDVITGTIKANFPTRISFQVSSKIDSRTILGEQGAEQLLGQGDMLYMSSGGRTIRIHCPFVSDSEVEKVTNALRAQGDPHYIPDILEDDGSEISSDSDAGEGGDDPMYKQAVELILQEGKASTSFLQRHLKIGYNRAARIIDMMEQAGIVSPANHVGKREIIGR